MGGDKSGTLPAGTHELSAVQIADEGKTIWGEVAGGGGWLMVMSAEHGVVAERVVEGLNDKPSDEEFEDPPAPNQMMLLSDMVLAWDPAFRKVLEEYSEDEALLTKEFGAAFKKLTELGCGF